MTPELLGPKELMARTGWSKSTFYRLQANHELDFLKAHPARGRRCYSKALVDQWCAGQKLLQREDRTFGRKASGF